MLEQPSQTQQPPQTSEGGAVVGPDNAELFATFRSAADSLTHEWGFVVVRTAYVANEATDEQQWAVALGRLRAHALPRDEDAEMDPGTLAFPVIAHRSILGGASYDTVRTAFKAWFDDYVRHKQQRQQELSTESDEEEKEAWESDVRRDCFLVVDETALASLLQAPDEPVRRVLLRSTTTAGGGVGNVEPFVVVVDATDPRSVPYGGGGPYTGWMRVYAASLSQLANDLDSGNSIDELCPAREYLGQIPLYDGSPCGKLIDPPGGTEGRYKFPKGTPRGIQAAKAMLEEIERATGGAFM
ncbi:hypothetical protein DL770_010074 [Monosporascus sp. CRB-9-2]|nr:hypothetical protein DL770_010074 [Monosporascus sp. CRB-9-2]